MGTDPPYIPAKFGDDTLRPKKVIHEKTQKLTGKKRTRQPDTRVSDKDIPYNRNKLSITSSKYGYFILKIKKVGQ